MTTKLSSSELHAEHAVRRIVPDDEEILWAAPSRGPTWRQWPFFVLGVLFLGWMVFLTSRSPLSLFPAALAMSLVWMLLGEWFYVFAVTSRRVIILRTLWPRSWIFADYSQIDPRWISINVGRRKIQFGGIENSFVPSGWWSSFVAQRGGMKQYVDNVPDVEAVRALILERISSTQTAPAATPGAEVKIPPPDENRWLKTTQ